MLPDAVDVSTIYADCESIRKFRLYWLPKSYEMMAHAPHGLVDGVGMTKFWDMFFSLVEVIETKVARGEDVKVVWVSEVERSVPTLKLRCQADTADGKGSK